MKGVSGANLKLYKRFYQRYKAISGDAAILLTLSAKSSKRFIIGWSHYVTPLSIDNIEAHNIYEIEAADNNWSVRELRRQINSSVCQRLFLSHMFKAGTRNRIPVCQFEPSCHEHW